MNQVLPLSLRPRRLSQLIGQEQLVEALRRQMTTRPPSAFLFHGSTGCGKTTVARIVAVSSQCTHQKVWGEPCTECWEQWNTFSIHEENASEVNGVEEIGKVAELGRYRPMPPSRMRVIILDEAQLMTNNAQNLLLKHFEDTSPQTVWIICTTTPNKILATLRRRCMSYQLKPLTIEGVETLLKQTANKIKLNRPLQGLLDQVHLEQISSPSLLLTALEKYAAGLSATEAVAGTDVAGTNGLLICRAVTDGDWVKLRSLLSAMKPEESRWIRASVGGWLRGTLLRSSTPSQATKVSESLRELTAMAPLEDGLLSQWLCATLWRICSRFSGAGK